MNNRQSMKLSRIFSIGGSHGVRTVLFFIVFLVGFLWVWRSAMRSGDGASQTPEVEKPQGLRGLSTADKTFFIDGKKMKILSGAMHYFRVLPEYWRDRMLKMRAAGLNTLETYVPWNLHEEIKGDYNFGGLLDIRSYIKTAHDLGLYVIVRPGPYICAEWDFGGLPSWLLRDPNMKVRSTYGPYLSAVESYFSALFPEIVDLQYTKGGPIIAFQIENEYGGYGDEVAYMSYLKRSMLKHGVKELLFTADNNWGIMRGSLPGVLMTANFKSIESGAAIFNFMTEKQPMEPLMVMEYWSGWFDHWGEVHNTQTVKDFRNSLKFILDADASVNFYMFHGGTNFGFMNGANADGPGLYSPTITSYDYDAPLSESGVPTSKFHIVRGILPDYMLKKKELPKVPLQIPSFAYGMIKFEEMLDLEDLLIVLKAIEADDLMPMEMLPINNGGGQSFGFILYRCKDIPKISTIAIKGRVRDRAVILVNGRETNVVEWVDEDPKIDLNQNQNINWKTKNTIDILVENLGRVNFVDFNNPILNSQRKGLFQRSVSFDFSIPNKWEIYPLQLKEKFIDRIRSSHRWRPVPSTSTQTNPAMFRGELNIAGPPKDTFIDVKGWSKGVIFVNGFNLGRYWNKGPQKTLYLPAPLLETGRNEILIFELHQAHSTVTLLNKASLG